MIDIENEIITTVKSYLESNLTSILVTSSPPNSPAQFPCVSIIEEDNSIDSNGIDSGSIENFVNVSYEINIYSNASKTKKSECKKILRLVNTVMVDTLGFQRAYARPLPAPNDKYYRIFARYVAKVDKNKVIYRS